MDGSQNLMMLAEGKDAVDWDPEGEAFSDVNLSRRQLGREGIIVYTEEFPQHSFSIILLTFVNNWVGWGESYWNPFSTCIEKKSFLDYFGRSIRQCLLSNKHQDLCPCPTSQSPPLFLVFNIRTCKSSALSARTDLPRVLAQDRGTKRRDSTCRVGDLSQLCE